MNLTTFVNNLQRRAEFRERIVHVEQLSPQMAQWAEPDAPLAPPVKAALAQRGQTGQLPVDASREKLTPADAKKVPAPDLTGSTP